MARELHVFDDFGRERAAGVSERGTAEAGMKFFGDGGAADDRAAFENERLVALLREVEGGDEGVVSAADDDDVARSGHGLVSPRIFQNFERGEAAGRAHDAAAGMGGGAAHVEILDGRAIARPAGDGPQEEKLLERKFSLKNIAFGEAGGALDIERRDDLLADDDVF